MSTALDDLVDALQSAESSVFRFEGRQDYPDDELWQAHLRGEWWEQSEDLVEWCALVAATVDRGAHWIRARVVTEPWTPYTRWEIEQHFPHNLTAGEDIRLVRPALPLDDTRPWGCPDFWLIDDAVAWQLTYDNTGADMTVTAIAPYLLPEIRTWRDRLLTVAVPMAVPAA